MEMTNRNRLPASSSNNTAAPVISVGGVDDGLLDNDNGRPSTNKPPFVPNEREPGEEDDSRGVRPTPGDRERPTDRPRTRPPKPVLQIIKIHLELLMFYQNVIIVDTRHRC